MSQARLYSSNLINITPRFETLRQFREQDFLTDVTFNVSDGITKRRISAHRVILAAASEYFQKLFAGTYLESSNAEININETNPEAFEIMINGIYGAEILGHPWKTQLDLFKLIRFFQIPVDLNNILLYMTIPPEAIPYYLQTLSLLFGGIPITVIPRLAGSIQQFVDLSSIPEDIITDLLTSSEYAPENEWVTWQIVNNVVQKGRDPELYRLVRFNSISSELLTQIPSEIIQQYNTGKISPSSLLTPNLALRLWQHEQEGPFVAKVDSVDNDGMIASLTGGINEPSDFAINNILARFTKPVNLNPGEIIQVDRFENRSSLGSNLPEITILEYHPISLV